MNSILDNLISLYVNNISCCKFKTCQSDDTCIYPLDRSTITQSFCFQIISSSAVARKFQLQQAKQIHCLQDLTCDCGWASCVDGKGYI